MNKQSIKITRKAPAFTLMELCISMLLTFFLAGIMYLSYQIIRSQTDQRENSIYTKILSLDSELKMAFFNAQTITNNGDKLQLEYEHTNITYLLSDSTILKQSENLTDTIYKGSYTCIMDSSPPSQYINQLLLEIKDKEETIKLLFSKKYYPNQQLRQKEVNFEY